MVSSVHETTNPLIAAQWLKQGNILAYPTESVWGIGCDAFNQSAVERILAIKQRPVDKGLIVIAGDICHLQDFLSPLSKTQITQLYQSWQPDKMEQENFDNIDNMNMRSSLVQPLDKIDKDKTDKQAHTWLLPIHKALSINIPKWIIGEHDSIAVRVIAHPLIQQLCQAMISSDNPYGFVVSTSCNPAGLPPAKTFVEADGYFGQEIMYLHGKTLGYHQPSHIRDIMTNHIIR